MNALGSYLAREDLGFAEFARRINATPPTVWRWAKGLRAPDSAAAVAIERATGGAVPVTSWRAQRRPVVRRTSRRTPHNRSKRSQ